MLMNVRVEFECLISQTVPNTNQARHEGVGHFFGGLAVGGIRGTSEVELNAFDRRQGFGVEGFSASVGDRAHDVCIDGGEALATSAGPGVGLNREDHVGLARVVAQRNVGFYKGLLQGWK